MSEQYTHVSVLLNESVDGLAIKPDGIYVDGTFGRGGHSRHILSQLGENGRLYAIDRDPRAIEEAGTIKDPRFQIIHGPFSGIETYLTDLGLAGKVDGVLLDLGVSQKVLSKSGSWLRYGDMQLGQGKEKARQALEEDPKLAEEIRQKILAVDGLDDLLADGNQAGDNSDGS